MRRHLALCHELLIMRRSCPWSARPFDSAGRGCTLWVPGQPSAFLALAILMSARLAFGWRNLLA
jgi:hypothetical protein